MSYVSSCDLHQSIHTCLVPSTLPGKATGKLVMAAISYGTFYSSTAKTVVRPSQYRVEEQAFGQCAHSPMMGLIASD